jgi:hypothetical protein
MRKATRDVPKTILKATCVHIAHNKSQILAIFVSHSLFKHCKYIFISKEEKITKSTEFKKKKKKKKTEIKKKTKTRGK